MRTLHMVILLLISTTAAAGKAGTEQPASWRLRCTQQNSKGYAVQVAAASKDLLTSMHTAMLRQGTIDRTDFCAITVKH
jgi:hypothetical protein